MSARPEQDMLSWLHCQILARQGAAEAVPHGPWHIEGRYPQGISNAEAIVIAETFTGPEVPPNIAQHIVAHDPRDTIAHCEYELWELARHEESPFRDCALCGSRDGDFPCQSLLRLAHAYRHLPGWRPEWAPE
ncbi:DUF6221 family protein [Sphaerisporangium aureirubrum]|uniref:DUF6221 family protein n=1 Tax=Sphaerisporangium aureirubrum TaxID=1544736 RepID=A0ABW1NDG6_9ACTN